MTCLVRQLHSRDSRRQFCPEGHWLSHRVNIDPAQVDRILIFSDARLFKKFEYSNLISGPYFLCFSLSSRSNVVIVVSQPWESFTFRFFVLVFDQLWGNCSVVGKSWKNVFPNQFGGRSKALLDSKSFSSAGFLFCDCLIWSFASVLKDFLI